MLQRDTIMLAAAREIDPRSVLIVNRGETRRREYPLGFESRAPILPGASQIVKADPQITFRGERLVVPSTIALFFVIEDVLVGNAGQLVSSTPVPAATFSETAIGVRLLFDTSYLGTISFRVRNVGPDALVFRATLIGTALE